MSRRWRILLWLVGVPLLAAVLWDRGQTIRWSGTSTLTVEFVVTDAETGQPVEGAAILIYDEMDSRHNEPPKPRAKTDRDGMARVISPHQRTGGRESGLRFTNTHYISVPVWHVWFAAPGFVETWPLSIEQDYRGAATRTGPRQAKLIIPVALRKVRP